MEFIKLRSHLSQIDNLIRQENTGNASEFAQKLGISEQTLLKQLQQLRELGIEIKYDGCKRTYLFNSKGRMLYEYTFEDFN